MIGAFIRALRRAREPHQPREYRLAPSRPVAGIHVSSENVLQVSAVFACVRYLSQMVAVLPWRVMRDTPSGAEPYPKHPLDYLIGFRPNVKWSAFQFRETLMSWALRHGNGYAEIERSAVGLPAALWPIHPDRVEPRRDDSDALVFDVDNGSGQKVTIPNADMFHIRGCGDGPIGVNVMAYAAQSIGWAKATQIFGAAFFGNGATPSGVVTMKRPLTPEGLDLLKKSFSDLYQGATKSNKTAFLDNEMDYRPISIDQEKSQFIETNHFLIEEICRWFGVPPHKIAHLLRSTFSNIEHQSIEVVVDSLTPWVKRFEEECDFKLFGNNRQGFFSKMYLQALMRGDSAARANYYTQMRQIGVFSVNDIRALEDMQTLSADTGADKLVLQSQFTTLERIGEVPPMTGSFGSDASYASPSSGDNQQAADGDATANDNTNTNENTNDNARAAAARIMRLVGALHHAP